MSDQVTQRTSVTPAVPDRSHLFLLAELLMFSLGLAGCLTMQVDMAQPAAYMDEIFHAPMTQKYCQGVYTEWHPKITTPPGLYALSSGLLRLFSMAQGNQSANCSLFRLRLTNLAYFAVNFLAVYGILSSKRHYGEGVMPEPRLRVLKTFCLAIFPVSFFFVGLFYTDQASLACLLTAYFMQLNDHPIAAGLLGCAAVACRQTNVVWLLFLLGARLDQAWLDRLRGLEKREREDVGSGSSDSDSGGSGGLTHDIGRILTYPREFIGAAFGVLLQFWPLVGALLGFAAFVYANGGVALGDKSAHEARVHSPQVMYFLAFAVAMHPAALPDTLARCQRWLLPTRPRNLAVLAGLCCLCCLAVRLHTYEHPYLLADNRHLTFYVWQRLFQRHWTVKYLLTPIYVACLIAYWGAVSRSNLFRAALLLCTALALVPAALIEPRYFIAPWMLWRLSSGRHDTKLSLLLEIAYFACLNAAVYWLFLRRPFHWPGVAEQQRFIW